MGSHAAFYFYLGKVFFMCAYLLVSVPREGWHISKNHCFQRKYPAFMISSHQKDTNEVRKGEVTGRWLFKEKLALVTQLRITKCHEKAWGILASEDWGSRGQIIKKHVGLSSEKAGRQRLEDRQEPEET